MALYTCIFVGDFDEDMKPYVKRLNKLPSVYTLYCCEGHFDSEYPEEHFGYIWIKSFKNQDRIQQIMEEIEDKFPDVCSFGDDTFDGHLYLTWKSGYHKRILDALLSEFI